MGIVKEERIGGQRLIPETRVAPVQEGFQL